MARDQVFISYSHKDKKWLERLQVMLAPLKRKAKIKVWADTQIDPGKKWKDEIKQALTSAKVAVLLVSPDFLASEFIHENELPPLLAAAEKEGLTILWVLVSDCSYQWTAIADYQAAYNPDKPLDLLRPAQRNSALVKIVGSIEKAWSSLPSPKTVNLAITAPQVPLHKVEQMLPTPQQQAVLALGLKVEFRDTLKDGSPGPEMVVIPAGEFMMGSPESESERRTDEGPQHKVVIAKPFAMGRYAVTFEEYDRFCEAAGRQKPGDEGWGRGRRPVINVTWHDSVAYCAWLSQETGVTYRLPSEAEWEYAARAGTTTAFWWGDDIDTTCANYDGRSTYRNGPKGEYRQRTVPVDTFQPNPFGLYQVHGNVWEWVQDNWHDNYEGAPGNGSAWVGESGSPCVLRGGSWCLDPRRVRGAARNWNGPLYGDLGGGFRLARTFP